MKSNLFPAILICMLLTLFAACSATQWAEFADVDPQQWDPLYVVEMQPQRDTLRTDRHYDLILCLRYKNDMAPRKVYLCVEEESLQTRPETRKVSLNLLDNGNNPVGHGNFGLYEVYDTLKRDFKVPEGYSVAIHPADNRPLPVGIVNVGLILSRR